MATTELFQSAGPPKISPPPDFGGDAIISPPSQISPPADLGGGDISPPKISPPADLFGPPETETTIPAGGELVQPSVENAGQTTVPQASTEIAPIPSAQSIPSPTPGTPPAPTTFASPEVSSDQTVQGQLSDLFTNKDLNPLWQYAEGQASAFSNSRGLLNSSMAAEAGAQAVFANALPIAAQDAQTYASYGLQAQQATIQSALEAQGHLESMVALSLQGDINSKLQLEQFGYNFELSEQENLHNLQLASLQGDIQATLALQQFGFDTDLMAQDFGFRLNLQDNELRNALQLQDAGQVDWLEQVGISHQNTLDQIAATADANSSQYAADFALQMQANYLDSVEARTSQFSFEVSQIYQTEGLTAAQQANAVAVARQIYLNDLSFIQDQYSQSAGWDPEWTGLATGSTLPGGATVPDDESGTDVTLPYDPPIIPGFGGGFGK